MDLSKKQIVVANEAFRKALNARNVDLVSAMKRCAKWWGIDRKDDEYIEAMEGNNKVKIDYILSFDMNDGEDEDGESFQGNYNFLKSLVKAKIINEPRGLEEIEFREDEPKHKTRSGTARHKMTAADGSELRPPKDVSDAEIKKALKQYGTINGAAKALNTRWSTINRRFDPEVIDELCGRSR